MAEIKQHRGSNIEEVLAYQHEPRSSRVLESFLGYSDNLVVNHDKDHRVLMPRNYRSYAPWKADTSRQKHATV